MHPVDASDFGKAESEVVTRLIARPPAHRVPWTSSPSVARRGMDYKIIQKLSC
jgi:hypothetical protein